MLPLAKPNAIHQLWRFTVNVIHLPIETSQWLPNLSSQEISGEGMSILLGKKLNEMLPAWVLQKLCKCIHNIQHLNKTSFALLDSSTLSTFPDVKSQPKIAALAPSHLPLMMI